MAARRFETLDALRGVAAFSVVVYHLDGLKMAVEIAPRGFLAVDFFFVLSGFVVAHAYEGPLGSWMSWRAFMVRRLIRLYPLVLLSIGVGLSLMLLKWRIFPDKVDSLHTILTAGLLNGLLLPVLSGGLISGNELFPINSPLWTLFLELLANMVWAWIGFGLRTRTLVCVVLVSWLAMTVFGVYFHSENLGYDMLTWPGGVARVSFGFTLGVVMCRLLPLIRIPVFRAGPVSLYIALILVMTCPFGLNPQERAWYELGFISIVLPLIVVIGIGQKTRGRFAPWIGALSYPIYVLHIPILLYVSSLRQTFLPRLNSEAAGGIGVVAVLVASALALRFYDEPLRRFLSRLVAKPPARGPRAIPVVVQQD